MGAFTARESSRYSRNGGFRRPDTHNLLIAACTTLMACTPFAQDGKDDARERRLEMVESQIRQRGVADARVLDVMRSVPRERFVPEDSAPRAYDDTPLAIGSGQTISQPYIVAYMTEALEVRSTDRVLEIGTGSGYQAAVLGMLAREVYTVEIVPALAPAASATLRELGYTN